MTNRELMCKCKFYQKYWTSTDHTVVLITSTSKKSLFGRRCMCPKFQPQIQNAWKNEHCGIGVLALDLGLIIFMKLGLFESFIICISCLFFRFYIMCLNSRNSLSFLYYVFNSRKKEHQNHGLGIKANFCRNLDDAPQFCIFWTPKQFLSG